MLTGRVYFADTHMQEHILRTPLPNFTAPAVQLLSLHSSVLPECRVVEVFGLITLKDVESVVNMAIHVVS